MMKIHKEHAIATLEAWAKFAELGSGRQHTTHFKTEREYIEYRMIDIGTMYVFISKIVSRTSLAFKSNVSQVLVWHGHFWDGY